MHLGSDLVLEYHIVISWNNSSIKTKYEKFKLWYQLQSIWDLQSEQVLNMIESSYAFTDFNEATILMESVVSFTLQQFKHITF